MTDKQLGVIKGLAIAIVITFSYTLVGTYYNIIDIANIQPLHIAFTALLLPGICLIICVARLAKFRFFSADDIDGSGLTIGTSKTKVLQAIIQNTLEQIIIAIIAYTSWAILMPITSLSVIIFSAITFTVGRILFVIGYDKGAQSRALGFGLTFYSSVAMIVVMILYLIITKAH